MLGASRSIPGSTSNTTRWCWPPARATGCFPTRNVLYLRTLAEAAEIRQRLAAANDVVVIGGGFIGLEVAAAARTLNKQVTVIEGQSRLMARVVAPVVSEYFRAQHEAKGVDVILNAKLSGINDKEVLLGERTRRPADLVIAGIGVEPNVELAREAGLPVGNGITVNEYLQTPDERIFAIGDCAESPIQCVHCGSLYAAWNRCRTPWIRRLVSPRRS